MNKSLYKYICLPLTLILLYGCVHDDAMDSANAQSGLRLEIAARTSFGTEDGVVLSKVRVIAIDEKGDVVFNRSTENGLTTKMGTTDVFEVELAAGKYTIQTVVNETTAMSASLNKLGSGEDLNNIEVKGSFTEEDVPLTSREQIILKKQNTKALVSTDGGNAWQDKLTTELVRTQSKATLYLRKKTGSEDVVTIKKVEICNLPDRCYLLCKPYTTAKDDLQTLKPYDDPDGIVFQADVADESKKDNYTQIFASGNIFPERWTGMPSSDVDAAYLKIYADYSGYNTVYTIKLHGDADSGFDLPRNVNYNIYATITSAGELDVNSVFIKPQWWDAEVNGDVEAPYLNISEIDNQIGFDRTADGVTTVSPVRVFFWTNVPGNKISVGDKIEIGSGDIQKIDEYITTEIHITRSNAAPGGGYDTAGYIDLISSEKFGWHAFNTNTQTYTISFSVGLITKKFQFKRPEYLYLPSVKFADMPCAGIYYKATQKGERIISAANEGAWSATVEYPAGVSGFVLLDPSLSADKLIYSTTSMPGDAENYPVTEGAQSILGVDRIYFRVGLTGASTETRNARIKLVTTTKTYYIYVKQGDDGFVMKSSDPASEVLPDGSLGAAVTRSAADVKAFKTLPLTYNGTCMGGILLSNHISSYMSSSDWLSNVSGNPSNTSQLFCWNCYNGIKSSTSYQFYIFHSQNPATAAISSFPHASANPTVAYSTQPYRDGSPVGYAQPTVAQLLNSLFRNIPQKAADGTYAGVPANPDDRNYQWGYYADGYFDRHIPYSINSRTETTDMTTPEWVYNFAYGGLLFYNPDSFGSLFFPAPGYRQELTGELRYAGLGGYIWAQDGDPSDATKKYGLFFSMIDGKLECRIVGDVHPSRAGSLRCVKL